MSLKHLRRQASMLVVLAGLALIVVLGLSLAPVYADDLEVGTGKTYATIQLAVNAAGPDDVILVYPGTYNESVDLSPDANPDGNLILRTVNNAGVPTAGTATVSPATGRAFRTQFTFDGNLTIEGFVVQSADDDGINIEVNGDVVVRNVTANGVFDDGINVESTDNLLYDGLTANNNGDDGIQVAAADNVTVTNCTASQNWDDGMDIDYVDGDVTITGCTTNENGQSNDPAEDGDGLELADEDAVDGNVTVSNHTSDGNRGDGIDIRHVSGLVSLSKCQTNQNHDDGVDIDAIPGSVALVDLTMNDNGDGDEDEAGLEVGEDDGVTGCVTVDTCTANDNDEDGLGITNVGGLVTMTHGIANRNGWGIWVYDVVGVVIIEHSEAISNTEEGIWVGETDAKVTLRDCEGSENSGGEDPDGIQIWPAFSDVELYDCTANDNDDDGMDMDNIVGDVMVIGSTTNGNGTGSGVDVGAVFGEEWQVTGTVVISGCTSLQNGTDGFEVWTRQDVTVTACTGNGNKDDGIEVDAEGTIRVTGFFADGNSDEGIDLDADGDVTISNATATNNGPSGAPAWGEGFYLESDGDLTVTNCTARGNNNDGFAIFVDRGVSVMNSVAQGNGDDGIDVEGVDGQVSVQKGGVLCENLVGLGMYTDRNADAEANWWGATSGPTHPSNPGVNGDEVWDGANKASGAVDFTPWIDTLDASATVDPVEAYAPTVVSFQISGAGGTVFMGPGPGDLGGTPPFTVTTDNGVLTAAGELGASIQAFVNQPDGVLAVTLTPNKAGTATVTLDGPCGLDSQLAIVVEPGTPPKPHVFLPIVLKKQ